MIEPEGRGLNSHPGQSFSRSLCGPISITRANAHNAHMGVTQVSVSPYYHFINYLITESEVVTGKSQTEALPY